MRLVMVLQAVDARDGSLVLWRQVAFHPSDGTLYSLGSDARTTVWDLKTGQVVRKMGQTSDWIQVQTLSSDGGVLAVGSTDGFLTLVDLARWQASVSTERTWQATEIPPGLRVIEDFQNSVRALAFSPDGQTIASGDDDGQLSVWEVATGNRTLRLRDTYGAVAAVAYAPDGQTLTTGTWGSKRRGVLKLRDTASGRSMWSVGIGSDVEAVAFHPDGTTIAVGAEKPAIQQRDAVTGKLRAVLDGHAGPVLSLAYSADGAYLASGGRDTTIRLWESSTGLEQETVSAHSAAVMSVAFGVGGTLLASASFDGTIKVWHL